MNLLYSHLGHRRLNNSHTGNQVVLFHVGRVVDEGSNFLAVFLREMLLRHLKRLVNALTDGNARNDHDELVPIVVLGSVRTWA